MIASLLIYNGIFIFLVSVAIFIAIVCSKEDGYYLEKDLRNLSLIQIASVLSMFISVNLIIIGANIK